MQIFFSPFAPWDQRFENMLVTKLTHLGSAWVSIVFHAHTLVDSEGLINASGQLVTNQNVPYSESIGAWYQNNQYKWLRLSMENGGKELIRACKEPTTATT